jgi:hypothetical protein
VLSAAVGTASDFVGLVDGRPPGLPSSLLLQNRHTSSSSLDLST